jgi:hypothetical protein
LLSTTPGRQALAPAIVLAADHVAVAVAQHGGQAVAFMALGHQERRKRLRMLQHPARETERAQRRDHLLVEVAAHLGGALRILALGGHRDPPRERVEQRTVVERAAGRGDGTRARAARDCLGGRWVEGNGVVHGRSSGSAQDYAAAPGGSRPGTPAGWSRERNRIIIAA